MEKKHKLFGVKNCTVRGFKDSFQNFHSMAKCTAISQEEKQGPGAPLVLSILNHGIQSVCFPYHSSIASSVIH